MRDTESENEPLLEPSFCCFAVSMDKQVTNTEITLASYPNGWITEENFQVKRSKLVLAVDAGTQEILVKNVWISLDPYMRKCMQETMDGLYIRSFELNKPIQAFAVSKVIVSDNSGFCEGDMVVALVNVAEYSVVPKGGSIQKIENLTVPLTYYLGVLGFAGHTAWVGVNVIGETKAGDEVYITAAAGAVGLVAGQLAKAKGCRVVGSAGSDEKVRILKEFGFDDAFNYKQEKDWNATLKRLFPHGIDVYFDNVGGAMLEEVLNHINVNGRVVACGMISQYNEDWRHNRGIRNMLNVIGKCVKIEGFLITNYLDKHQLFIDNVTDLIQQGKLKYKEHIVTGIENYPKTFVGLFKGENIGKSIVHVDT